MPRMFAPPAPLVVPQGGDIDSRLSILADAISHKADATSVPVYTRVRLIAPDGSVWAVSVDATGALQTEVVTR